MASKYCVVSIVFLLALIRHYKVSPIFEYSCTMFLDIACCLFAGELQKTALIRRSNSRNPWPAVDNSSMTTIVYSHRGMFSLLSIYSCVSLELSAGIPTPSRGVLESVSSTSRQFKAASSHPTKPMRHPSQTILKPSSMSMG